MSTAKTIIQHMRLFLPQFTDLFSDQVAISSMTNSGGTVTVTTSGSHGLSTGNTVTISGSQIPIDIDTLTRSGTIGTATTLSDTDLTQDYVKTITLTGSNEAEFNGTFTLLTVPNRRTFTFRMADSGATTATGSPQLQEDHRLGYNGQFQIVSTGATTFTLTNSAGGLGTAATVTNAFVNKNIRISGDATIEHLMESYTDRAPDKACGFVVLGAGVFNKDRRMENDAVSLRTLNDNYQIRLITPFSFYVFLPTDSTVAGENAVSGRGARDLMEDLRVPLYRTLLRYKVPSPFVSCPYSVLTAVSHSTFEYNTAFYVHEFEFEYAEDIVSKPSDGALGSGGDTVPVIGNRAFRDINNRILNEFEEIIKDDSIDLDEDPLP